MGFLTEIGRKTTETTSKLAREAKLKLKISDNKNKISDLYEEMGKKVYEKHVLKEKIEVDIELKEEIEKIDVLADEIEKAEEEILDLNDKRKCDKCKAEIKDTDTFCPGCGEKQAVKAEVVKEEPKAEEEKKEEE